MTNIDLYIYIFLSNRNTLCNNLGLAATYACVRVYAFVTDDFNYELTLLIKSPFIAHQTLKWKFISIYTLGRIPRTGRDRWSVQPAAVTIGSGLELWIHHSDLPSTHEGFWVHKWNDTYKLVRICSSPLASYKAQLLIIQMKSQRWFNMQNYVVQWFVPFRLVGKMKMHQLEWRRLRILLINVHCSCRMLSTFCTCSISFQVLIYDEYI